MAAVDTAPGLDELKAGWIHSEWSADAAPALLEAVRDPAASRQPARGIKLTTPVALDAGDRTTAGFLRLLCEAISRQVGVEWRLGRVSGVDPRQLVHLPPPVGSEDPELQVVAGAWRASHAYGLLYYRVGPGFTTIKDTRHAGSHARFRIVDPQQVADFAELVDFAGSVGQDAPPAAGRQLAASLLEENLAVEIGGLPVPLPFRMRIWPVPYAEV